ncbi:MAG TPA: MFS transporter [Thermomicrobiales bacterium]|nr:MFS transporter [Thermomicrobiales bacterium]
MGHDPPLDQATLGATDPGADTPEASSIGYRTVLRHREVRVLAVSRAANKMAMSTVSYGAMVHLGQVGATQFQISLVSASSYLAALLFGVQGGTVADSLSKRLALAAGQGVMAGLCFAIPSLLGTSAGDLMLLMFLSSFLMQIVSPGLKAAVALVATPSELAVTSALVSVIGSVASGFGSAFLAPLLIKLSGIETVLYVSGMLYAVGSIRSLALAREQTTPVAQALRGVDWRPTALSLRSNAQWIIDHRAVATMILGGAIVVALFEAFNTLIPLYVRDVLDSDPANSVYIFAPAGVGFLIGTFLAPPLIQRWGERRLAIVSLIFMSASMAMFGLIDAVAPILAPISPLRLLEPFGITLNDKVLAASVIAIPMNFGSTASGAAVANFINRRVPLVRQGAVFGLEESQENALILATVLAVGAVAGVAGPQVVMVVAPIVAVSIVVLLLSYSYRSVAQEHIAVRDAFDMLAADDNDRDTVPDHEVAR